VANIWKTYGCEKIKPIYPKKIQAFFNRMEWKHILQIPRRKKGLTSSGEPAECHQNVNKLVNTMGGKALRGYWITENEDQVQGLPVEEIKNLSLFYHSVWISPEGNASDVTMRNHVDEYEPWFIPLYETTENTMKIWFDIKVDENWVKEGLELITSADRAEFGKTIKIGQFKRKPSEYKDEVRQKWTDEGKGFSKPSIVSKMSWDEFEKIYRDQREFKGFGEKTPTRITDAVRQIKD
jgi:hypothetical protein